MIVQYSAGQWEIDRAGEVREAETEKTDQVIGNRTGFLCSDVMER